MAIRQKEDEAMGLKEDSENSSKLFKTRDPHILSNLEQESLTNEDKTSSQISSNVDSVYSFYNQNSQNTQIIESPQKADLEQIDIRKITNQLNANLYSESQEQKEKAERKKSARKEEMGTKDQPVEVYTFLQGKSSRQKVKLSKQSAALLDPYQRKYGLQMSEAPSAITNEFQASEAGSFNQQEGGNMVIMGSSPQKAQNECQGIYINNQIKKKKPTPKKKHQGKDIRYQMKALEKASVISSDDFFMNEFDRIQPKISPTSGDMEPRESELDQITKRQKLNEQGREQKLIQKKLQQNKLQEFLYENCQYPVITMGDIKQQKVNRLTKTGCETQKLYNYVEKGHDRTQFGQNPSKMFNVLSVEFRYGVGVLIGKCNQEVYRIIMNPFFSKLRVQIGDVIEVADYILLVLDPKRQLQTSEYSILEGIQLNIDKVIVPKAIVNMSNEDKQDDTSMLEQTEDRGNQDTDDDESKR